MCVLEKIDRKRRRIRQFYKYFHREPNAHRVYSLWYHPGTTFPRGYPIGKWIDSHSFVTSNFLWKNPFVNNGNVRTPYGFQGYMEPAGLLDRNEIEYAACYGKLRLCKIRNVKATGKDMYGHAAAVARYIKICTIKETKKSLGI